MKLLVIGGGGREHALVWKLAQSPRVTRMWCAPGNAGIAEELLARNGARVECVNIGAEGLPKLLALAREKKPDLTVVGPDNPLALGIVDLFQKNGLRIWGPNQRAAQFESSKVFAQEFMEKHGIPTARAGTFSEERAAREFAASLKGRCAVKADGLALGKGVLICRSMAEAERAIAEILVNKAFGAAGAKIVIQELLEGPEISLHALCDGKTAKLFPTAQDHKRALDGDQGLNTGGMGTYSPTPFLNEMQRSIPGGPAKAGTPNPETQTAEGGRSITPVELGSTSKRTPLPFGRGEGEGSAGTLNAKGGPAEAGTPNVNPKPAKAGTPSANMELAEVGRRILGPWLEGCAKEGIDFRGILYPGVMLTADGPKVLEFNARFGDPETQVYLTRLENDLVELLEASVDGTLDKVELKWSATASVCVVMASGGYPGAYTKGKVITGLTEAGRLPHTKVFHAGTARAGKDIVTNGGRVLGVTAWAADLPRARAAAYAAVEKIQFDGAQFRRDIGGQALRPKQGQQLRRG